MNSIKPDQNNEPNRKRAAITLFCVWAFLISAPLSYMGLAHWTPLPITSETVSHTNSERWKIVHVLSADCACSRSVFSYLRKRGISDSFEEEIVLLDADSKSSLEDELRNAGFDAIVGYTSESFCSATGAEGVPFFQVISPDQQVKYSGAYFEDKGRLTVGMLDLDTAKRAQNGIATQSRPVFGCPISERFKKLFNPLQ